MPRIVLIVEDSETCAETLEIAVSTLDDIVCRTVHSVREAQAALNAPDRPSLLITDLHFPASSGFDVIRHVRADERYAGMPILLISGDSDPDLAAKARAAGADAFFAKPYSPAAVRRTVESFLCA